jgi:hypothetical protein
MPGPSRGGLKGSRDNLTRPKARQMTSVVMLCLVRKLARVGKVAVLLHTLASTMAKGLMAMARAAWRSSPTCRVYTSSPLLSGSG